MRVVIGYDGSACAKAAIDDLPRAGLPDTTSAVIAVAADLWPVHTEWSYQELTTAQQENMPPIVRNAYELAMAAIRDAHAIADDGAARLCSLCPQWKVSRVVRPGSSAASLIQLAAECHADIVAVGSRGRSRLSGLILGSVSRKVLAQAWCSVRIGRCADGRQHDRSQPVRLVLGMDGSQGAALAAAAICMRQWPVASEIRVVAALDDRLATAFLAINVLSSPGSSSPRYQSQKTWMTHVTESVAEDLRDAHLQTSIVVREGDPRRVLPDEAERFGADCIFLGAIGHGRFPRLALGSVSMAVAESAPCTVEVVRHDTLARQDQETMRT